MAIVGFIGTGNMGSAIARAACKSNQVNRLLLSNRSPEKAERLAKELGGEISDNRQVAASADVLFLAVKPQYLLGMFDGIRDVLEARKDRFIIVSMVAGWTLDRLTRELGVFPFVRIMPDIPAQVGAGITLVCPGKGITAEEKALVLDLLDGSGLVSELDEKQLDAANGVTGCGPAFAAMFVEALADGAVACGLPRQRAPPCSRTGSAPPAAAPSRACASWKSVPSAPRSWTRSSRRLRKNSKLLYIHHAGVSPPGVTFCSRAGSQGSGAAAHPFPAPRGAACGRRQALRPSAARAESRLPPDRGP